MVFASKIFSTPIVRSGQGWARALLAPDLINCVDYSVVGDTPDYVDAKLNAPATAAACDVVSGVFVTTTDGESSFNFKSTVLDLNNYKKVSVEAKGCTFNTSFGHLVLFLSADYSPGSAAVLAAGTLTGYDMVMGNSTTASISRVIAGTRTVIGTVIFTSYAGDDCKLEAVILPDRTILRAYKNGSQVGNDIIDTSAERTSNFRTVGKGMRQATQTTAVTGLCAFGEAATFGGLPFFDDFDRADTTPGDPVGTGWVPFTDLVPTHVSIASNVLQFDGITGASGEGYNLDVDTNGATYLDQSFFFTKEGATDTGHSASFWFGKNLDNAYSDGYLAIIHVNGVGPYCNVYRVVSGSESLVSQVVLSQNPASGRYFRVVWELIDDEARFKVYSKATAGAAWTLDGTVTDTNAARHLSMRRVGVIGRSTTSAAEEQLVAEYQATGGFNYNTFGRLVALPGIDQINNTDADDPCADGEDVIRVDHVFNDAGATKSLDNNATDYGTFVAVSTKTLNRTIDLVDDQDRIIAQGITMADLIDGTAKSGIIWWAGEVLSSPSSGNRQIWGDEGAQSLTITVQDDGKLLARWQGTILQRLAEVTPDGDSLASIILWHKDDGSFEWWANGVKQTALSSSTESYFATTGVSSLWAGVSATLNCHNRVQSAGIGRATGLSDTLVQALADQLELELHRVVP